MSQTIEQTKTQPPAKSFYLKANPFTILWGQVPFTGEYRLGLEMVGNSKVSYQVLAGYLTKSPLLESLVQATTPGAPSTSDIEMPGFRLQGQVRRYVSKFTYKTDLKSAMLPSGVYVALHASYAQANLRYRGVSTQRTTFTNANLLGLAGLQLLTASGFGLDVFGGLGYKRNTITEYDYFGRAKALDLEEFQGAYYASPVKITLGFNFTIGLF